MSELEQLKHEANKQVQELVKKNIFKEIWDVKIITISSNQFLYIDCNTSKINIKSIKELCRQHLTKDIIYKLDLI
jgi:hypothetical protein